ncbi:hypothetical protein ASG42_25820 [Rhizobium sp. Leaf391]|nr:hypothetical protein ASG42_25820 [Rhizobium sp. Leaf391]
MFLKTVLDAAVSQQNFLMSVPQSVASVLTASAKLMVSARATPVSARTATSAPPYSLVLVDMLTPIVNG